MLTVTSNLDENQMKMENNVFIERYCLFKKICYL